MFLINSYQKWDKLSQCRNNYIIHMIFERKKWEIIKIIEFKNKRESVRYRDNKKATFNYLIQQF